MQSVEFGSEREFDQNETWEFHENIHKWVLSSACWCKAQISQHRSCPKAGAGCWSTDWCSEPWNCLAQGRVCAQPLHVPPLSPSRAAPSSRIGAGPGVSSTSSKKCSCNHFIAYTMIALHCRIKRFFHIQCRSQPQSLLYLLTHFIKFTSFLLCLCTSVPSAVCTKSYWHFNIKLLWQEDIPLAK